MDVSMGLAGSTTWCRLRAVERGGGQLGRDDLDVSFGFCGCVYDDRFALEGVVLRCCVVVVCCGDVGRGCGAGRELSRRAAVAASADQQHCTANGRRKRKRRCSKARARSARAHTACRHTDSMLRLHARSKGRLLPTVRQHVPATPPRRRSWVAWHMRSASTPPREGPATAPALPEFVPCCPLHCRNTYKGRAFTRVTL